MIFERTSAHPNIPQIYCTVAIQADHAAEAEKDRADLEEIRRREKQHFEDVLKVKDIKETPLFITYFKQHFHLRWGNRQVCFQI